MFKRTTGQPESPIASIFELARQYRGTKQLIDLTQGAPNYAPPPPLIDHVRSVALSDDGARYTDRLGLPHLRAKIAADMVATYSGSIEPANVLVTAGCNQAFCLASSALADIGDEIILPVPYYFNHNMWLQMERVVPKYMMLERPFIPDPKEAAKLISSKTRAIVLVTPGNPTGAVIPSAILIEFADLAKANGLKLIVDETYRHFGSVDTQFHDLFRKANWHETAVFLYSFSKEFAIPGYRVGAAIADPKVVAEMMKLMDCVAICAPRIGQEAVAAGLMHCTPWRRQKAMEIRERQAAFEVLFRQRPGGFELMSLGAFFGWVQHPDSHSPTPDVIRRLIMQFGIVSLPGTLFSPRDDRQLRMSFGGLAHSDMAELRERLTSFGDSV
jgi:aspartate/methionine/tyrosine aminotransferase